MKKQTKTQVQLTREREILRVIESIDPLINGLRAKGRSLGKRWGKTAPALAAHAIASAWAAEQIRKELGTRYAQALAKIEELSPA